MNGICTINSPKVSANFRKGLKHFLTYFKGELQREHKLTSYERTLKNENDMYIVGIGQAVLKLLSLKVGSGNLKPQENLLTSEIFGHLRHYEARSTENDVTSDKSQFPNIKN